MSLDMLISALVEERSLDALEQLTGSRSEEVLEALLVAAGRIIASERADPSDDMILERLREHLVASKPLGILCDAIRVCGPITCEFALSCLGEIGDLQAVEPMLELLAHEDPRIREAAAEHLALLTKTDFGQEAPQWRAWNVRRLAGSKEQYQEP